MRLSARFWWFELHIDTTRTTDMLDVEHVATITAYNTVQQEMHNMYCEDCGDE